MLFVRTEDALADLQQGKMIILCDDESRENEGDLCPMAQRAQFQAEHLAEVQALAMAQGLWIDVPVNFAHGWKRPA